MSVCDVLSAGVDDGAEGALTMPDDFPHRGALDVKGVAFEREGVDFGTCRGVETAFADGIEHRFASAGVPFDHEPPTAGVSAGVVTIVHGKGGPSDSR